jgi:hypothetical protein
VANPFSDIFDALWAAAEAHTPLTDLVRPGNRPRSQPKRIGANQPADTPELRLRLSPGGGANPSATSSTAIFQQNFEWAVGTSSKDTSVLLAVKWELVRAMAVAQVNNLGLAFVTRMAFPDLSESDNNPDLDRGTPGWSGVYTVSVEFQWDRAALLS